MSYSRLGKSKEKCHVKLGFDSPRQVDRKGSSLFFKITSHFSLCSRKVQKRNEKDCRPGDTRPFARYVNDDLGYMVFIILVEGADRPQSPDEERSQESA